MKNRKLLITSLVVFYLFSTTYAGLFDNLWKKTDEKNENPTKTEQIKKTDKSDKNILVRQNQLLSSIAKKAMPSVVNISSVKKIRFNQYSPFQYFFNDPLLDQFFGNQYNRRRSRPKEQIEKSLGSGFILSEDGYILTNAHVIAEADEVVVNLSDKREFEAKVIGFDKKTDLALLKIKADNLTPLLLGDSDRAQVGEMVLALGNPFGLGETLTMGIISAKGRNNLGINDYENFIQTDASINPGNSGGPLLNIHGEVIGINTAIFSRSGGSQGVGFAIPANMAKFVKDSLLNEGKVTRAYLGVYIQDLTSKIAKGFGLNDKTKGALVSDVIKDSPADKAGIKTGDIVLEFNGKQIKSSAELRNFVATNIPGSKATVKILRSGKPRELTVKLEKQESEKISEVLNKDINTFLGSIELEDLNRRYREEYQIGAGVSGIVITRVLEGGVAEHYGIRMGDVIRAINNQEIRNKSDFHKALKKLGSPYVCLIYRNGRTYYIVVEE